MKTDREYAELMKKTLSSGDTECDHSMADGLLCDILNDLGFTETVKAFESGDKWYA